MSLPDEAERVTRRICVDPPAALAAPVVNERGAEPEGMLLGLLQILDPKVEMELLGASRIAPPRRPVVLNSLEGEHQPGI